MGPVLRNHEGNGWSYAQMYKHKGTEILGYYDKGHQGSILQVKGEHSPSKQPLWGTNDVLHYLEGEW